ncbi:PAS domain S-box protein [Methanolobus sp. ZRKC5]|uniref:hybrid sensor histidine kinase/response regulator n=1 Tax=unclassified Methanolobus TaxID=2629569 RepID=UPI00313AB474
MTENQVLKILFVEDMPEDLELAKRKIKDYGIRFETYLAQNETEFLQGLYEFEPDIIISDYLLPEFDGMRALEYSLTYDNTVPFIILTGFINEEIAVDSIKAGATDYVLKERISRLPSAIKEAIKKKSVLLENKQATESLEFMSKIIEQSPYSIISTDMEGIITSWNKGAKRTFGFTSEEALGQHISLLYHDTYLDILNKDIIEPLLLNGYHQTQVSLKRKSGESFIGSLYLWLIKDITGQASGMVGYTLDITKRVKAEEELRIKDQAIECNVDGIALLELDGRISYANETALKIWGYENKAEVVGKNVEEFFDTKYKRSEILEIIKDKGFKSERNALRKDGTIFPVWVSTTTIKDASGNSIAYMGSLVDITKIKRSQEALKESEEKYRLLAENTLDCIWLMDMNMAFTYVNPAIYSILGFLPEEWIGSKLSDHCDEKNFMKIMDHAKIGMESSPDVTELTFQAEMLNKNGDNVPIEITGKILHSTDGIPIGFHGNARDITKRILAEEALKESEDRLKLAMMVSEHGFWEWELDLNEFYFSPNSYNVLGYEDQEFPMSPEIWGKLLHPEDRKNILPEIISSIKEEKTFTFEIRMLSGSGKWRWILAKGATFNGNRGSHRAIGTLVDITERKKTEEQMLLARIAAEEANRCKNGLLTNMNHELRTPLNSVIGYSDVLIDQNIKELDDKQKKYLQIINDAGYKLLNLINNVLDLAQIEAEGMGLKFSAFEPAEYVEEVIRSTKLLATKKKININVNIDESTTEITADVDKFKEILYNLVENALKFTPEKGTVTVNVKVENEEIEVSVEDTGIGIAEEDRERIFNSFIQVDSSNTKKYGGAGLGLALVKEYLKMQSGNIWVEGESGKGSKFIFRIPVYPKERATDI